MTSGAGASRGRSSGTVAIAGERGRLRCSTGERWPGGGNEKAAAESVDVAAVDIVLFGL